jgi:hypothetical protein
MPSFVLSSQGLERAASICEKDFMFIGKQWQIPCTKFQAAFFSPRVHRLLQEDKTVDSICIEWVTHGKDGERIFALLEALTNGFGIEPTESEVCGLLEVGSFLGNQELLDKFLVNEGAIDKCTVCSRLRTKSAAGLSVEEEIEFAASHFYELDFEELKGIEAQWKIRSTLFIQAQNLRLLQTSRGLRPGPLRPLSSLLRKDSSKKG